MQTSDMHMQTAAAAGQPTIILQPTTEITHRRTATEHSARLLPRRCSRKNRRQRSCSDMRTETISPEEYEALPLSIQRKYFSAKERMHIAQQAAGQMRKKQSIKGSWLAPPTPTSPGRPSTSAGTLSMAASTSTSRSGMSLFPTDQDLITEDQARWFLLLPDKVRKQHFSREEQVALMVACKKVLEHVSPEMAADVYRRVLNFSNDDQCRSMTKAQPSTMSEPDHEYGESYFNLEVSSECATEDADEESEVFKSCLREDSQSPPVPYTVDGKMGLRSIPPPPPVPFEAPISTNRPKRRSFARRHSLTPLPLPAPTLAPPEPVPQLPSMDQVRHFELSAKQAHPSTEQTVDIADLPRKYYLDEDARSKLRSALTSTDKFDQALAFGFSPTEDRHSSESTDSSLPVQQPALYHSEQEDDIDDAQSVGTHGPRTPTPTHPNDDRPAIKQASFDSGFELPYAHIARPRTSGGRAPSTHSREMTIHMTLTRRDLLSPSPEEKLYSVQRFQNTGVDVEQVDPLALEPITVSDDASGAHGAFAVNEGVCAKGLKRVFKSLIRH